MSVYQNENGKYYCIFRFRDFSGKLVQKKKSGFLKKSDAKNYERREMRVRSGRSDILFSELVTLFLNDKKNRIKETTYERYEDIAIRILTPVFGEIPVGEITSLMIRTWQNSQLDIAKKTTIQVRNQLLGQIIKYAYRFFGLRENVFAKAGVMEYRRDVNNEQKIEYWTYDEFQYFLRQLGTLSPYRQKHSLIFKLLFFSGMRRGEVLALRLCDIDFESNTIKIRQNMVKTKNGFVLSTTKTSSSVRNIAMPSSIMNEFQKYVDRIYKIDKDDLIFSDTNLDCLSQEFLHLQRKLKIKNVIKLHGLRHSHASLLLEKGFSVQSIADRLGHKNCEQVIKVYGHLYKTRRDEIAEALNKIC